MCSNYESRLEAAQQNERKLVGQLQTLKRHLQSERQALTNQDRYIAELEANLKNCTEHVETQVNKITDN